MKKDYISILDYKSDREIVNVTIILNIWKRSHLAEQLYSLLSQSVLPKEIWVIHYENHVIINNIIDDYKDFFQNIHVINSSKNLKYFGRFSIAINVVTEFVWIIDDDVIPGKNWLANCVEKCVKFNSIISCTGRIIPKGNFEPERLDNVNRKDFFIGDMTYIFKNYCKEDTLVDYGCNSYFLKSKWLSAYWSIWPANFLTGEDIHLSATCKTTLDVNTYVITQNDDYNSGNLKKIYGNDDTATWKTNDFIYLRRKVLEYHILTKKWNPIKW